MQVFDVMLDVWAGRGASLCDFMQTYVSARAIEHYGALFSCDRCVYLGSKRGNNHQRNIAELTNSSWQRDFGLAKRRTSPMSCRKCELRFACYRECPKHCFSKTPVANRP